MRLIVFRLRGSCNYLLRFPSSRRSFETPPSQANLTATFLRFGFCFRQRSQRLFVDSTLQLFLSFPYLALLLRSSVLPDSTPALSFPPSLRRPPAAQSRRRSLSSPPLLLHREHRQTQLNSSAASAEEFFSPLFSPPAPSPRICASRRSFEREIEAANRTFFK